MSFSIRMTDQEEKLAKDYAKLNGMTLSEAFKRALFEKIEDEYDIALAETAHKEFLKDPETFSLEEVMREAGDDV